MQSIKIRAVAGLILGACTIYGLPAMAADSGDASDAGAQSQSAENFSDQQLKQFVEAQNNVQDVLQEWQGKVDEADDQQAAQQEENKAMVEAVKDSGLTPEQYNNIARAAQKDPQLTKRIQSFMTPQ